MSRFDIYKDEDMLLQGEMEANEIFIHCDVYNWSPSIMKKVYYIWDVFIEELKDKGVNTIYTLSPDDKALKFAQLFGFECQYKISHKDGYFYFSQMEVE